VSRGLESRTGKAYGCSLYLKLVPRKYGIHPPILPFFYLEMHGTFHCC